jgi:iron-sulfur cluster assembly protein
LLTITPPATEDAPEGAGIRISQGVDSEGQSSLALAVVEEPEAGDEVVEEAGAPVFVAPDAAPLLDDKVLDVRYDAGQVGFVVGEQA